MANTDDDDVFSDDGFDELPVNTLHELEQKAFLSTQQAQAPLVQRPKQNHPSRDDEFAQANGEAQYSVAVNNIDADEDIVPPSSDYGFDDEDVIDLDDPSVVIAARHVAPNSRFMEQITERNQWRHHQHAGFTQHVYGRPSEELPLTEGQMHVQQPPINLKTYRTDRADNTAIDLNNNGVTSRPHGSSPPESNNFDVGELQARIQELERERFAMLKSVEDAKSLALSKSGEIAIVRANQDKATKDYERKLAVMQKLHADEIAKQKVELDAARKDREKMEVNNRFLEHDLAQEAERARNAKRKVLKDATGNVSRAQPPANISPAATPRKNRAAPFRDGFDDDEVMFVSPTKAHLGGKQKISTPRAATKRKRMASETNSPGQPLPMSQPKGSPQVQHLEPPEAQLAHSHIADSIGISSDDGMFQFMHTLHNHRPYEGHDRTFEALTKHCLPSAPETSLYSVLYDSLSGLDQDESSSLPTKLCRTVLSMWSDCLREQYYPPIYLLLDLLQLVLALSSSATANALIETIVSLSQATADLVAVPIVKASTANAISTNIKHPSSPPEPPEGIDVYEVLSLLQAVASSCCAAPASDVTNLLRFWSNMEFDFILLMLNRAQPLAEIMLMLNLLVTSPLESTFGAIVHGEVENKQERQVKNETGLIERLSLLLFDMPSLSSNEEPYQATEIVDLRIAVLTTLSAIGTTEHGGSAIAKHRNALGRLVHFIHDTIERLYDYTPDVSLTTKLSIAINLSTRLLAYLLNAFKDMVDMRQKLAVIPGGIHKYLIALTRLAFTDMVFFERGIEEEVSDLAHEMLDEFLSPEEGEAVTEAFGSARQ